MSVRINPPQYRPDKSYERYRQELLAWNEITEIPARQKGTAVALSLPEDDPSSIREKAFDQIDLDTLKSDTGLHALIALMDKYLKKDDLADCLEKFEKFEDCKKEKEMTMTEYITMFDHCYNKIKKKGIVLPSEVLAFKLLRKAMLTKEEKMLVLTGMDFTKRNTLFEQASVSLKKFLGEGIIAKPENTEASRPIKVEPTFTVDQVYTAQGGRRPTYSNHGRGRGSPRGFRGNHGYSRGGYNRNYGHFTARGRYQRDMNPTGRDGRTLRCLACGSFRHLVSDCTYNVENSAMMVEEAEDQVYKYENIVLYTGGTKIDMRTFSREAQNAIVLDSACSSTVCGQEWMDTYLMTLGEEQLKEVKSQSGEKVFKFGGGEKLKSVASYTIPVSLAGVDVKINTDVVMSDIPLLWSKNAMKKARVKLDLENDSAEILGRKVLLNETSSGHYCLPINNTDMTQVDVNVVRIADLNEDEQHKTLVKLHRQFAHPGESKLKSLLKDAGVWDEKFQSILQKIYENCDLCKRYAPTPPRPVVALPMARRFNEKVCMDLKKWNKLYILHIVDMWSRFTVSVFRTRKTTQDVLNCLLKHWIGTFGVMEAILTDNGGEFNSDEMREVASILNVETLTTGAYSPFQNGLCERVHAVTDMMLLKLEDQYPETGLDILLCWTNMAKNSLQMWHGYSSYQLVFGKNPNLPNIMSDQPPALGGIITSDIFARHLNALHSARKAFIESECCERIRRALRHKVRAAEEVYRNGDRVYYKREGSERWFGPGKVVFQDGRVVFVRHGGVYTRVSMNRLSKAEKMSAEIIHDEKKDEDITVIERNNENDKRQILGAECREPSCQEGGVMEEKESCQEEGALEEKESLDDSSLNQAESYVKRTTLKTGDFIEYRENNEENWTTATIKGRAGKATGQYKNWYNIKTADSKEQSINLDGCEWRKVEECNAVMVPRTEHNNTKCQQAKKEELEKLAIFKTYQEVEDTGQKRISTRWVISVQANGKIKARLVARGFEEEGLNRTDSPTVSKTVLKLFLAIAASKGWSVKTTDIKSAFLQGKRLEREVFLQPPVEADVTEGNIWKLEHCLYGLGDAARQFYFSVVDELTKLGCMQSRYDPALFYLKQEDDLKGIIISHVDDFLHVGCLSFEENVMSRLRKRFIAGKVEENAFRYVGFHIKQYNQGIVVSQEDYVADIDNETLAPARVLRKDEVLTPAEQTQFRGMVGRINWAVQGSRPDAAFEMIDLSTKLNKATVADHVRASKVIKKLKDGLSSLCFPNLGPSEHWRLVAFSDASLGNLSDGVSSVGAHLVFLVNPSNQCCPVSWQAKKIKRVVRSTIAAEAMALLESLEDCIFLRAVIQDMLNRKQENIHIEVITDNRSVVEALQSTKLVEDRRLRIDIAAIRQELVNGDVKVSWCPGEKQLADGLTKRGPSTVKLCQTLQSGKLCL